mgnify:CR=1 FL=1
MALSINKSGVDYDYRILVTSSYIPEGVDGAIVCTGIDRTMGNVEDSCLSSHSKRYFILASFIGMQVTPFFSLTSKEIIISLLGMTAIISEDGSYRRLCYGDETTGTVRNPVYHPNLK